MWDGKQQLELDMEQNWERSTTRLYIVPRLIQLNAEYIMDWRNLKLELRFLEEISATSNIPL